MSHRFIYRLYIIAESWTEWRLDHIVCWLYTNCLRHLPVLVRQWWSAADSRVSATIDKITTHYVSPVLCQEELLNNRLVNMENMQVHSLRSLCVSSNWIASELNLQCVSCRHR